MKISVAQVIPYPRPVVFGVLRDHLPELAAYLTNIEYIQRQGRTELAEGGVELTNLWQAAKTEVPMVARAVLDPAKLSWLDTSRWEPAKWSNTWSMKVSFMQERVTCHGVTSYHERGDGGTDARIDGVLELDLKGMLPGLLARRAAPKIEAFVINLIKPNFEKTNEGLIQYLEAHPELAS